MSSHHNALVEVTFLGVTPSEISARDFQEILFKKTDKYWGEKDNCEQVYFSFGHQKSL